MSNNDHSERCGVSGVRLRPTDSTATTSVDPVAVAFIRESNRIEGIHRAPTAEEIEEYHRFMAQDEITLRDVLQFVSVYQPGAEIRDRPGMNVSVGDYYPPAGDITIKTRLLDILADANASRDDPREAYQVHVQFETLHPLTDCNGRSGRMLWMWMMREAPLNFLHHFYYQALEASRPVKASNPEAEAIRRELREIVPNLLNWDASLEGSESYLRLKALTESRP